MKKKTGIYNETSGRKWRLICITLVLIFSVISISATGAESKTNSQTGDKIVHESDTGVSNETEDNCLYCIVDENYTEVDCFDCTESGEDNNTGDKCSYCIESDEKNNTGSKCSSCTKVYNKSKTGTGTSTEIPETVVYNKSKTGTGTSTETQKTVVYNKSKTGTGTSTETQKTVVYNKSKTGTGTSTETPETVVDNKSKTGTGTSTETQKTVAYNKSKTGTGTSTETQKTVVYNKSKTGSGTSTETPETVVDNKSKTGTGTSTETQKTVAYNKSKTGSGTSTETPETVVDNKSKTGSGTSTETPETVVDNKSKTGTGTSTETPETVIDNKSKTGAEESTETPETVVYNKSKTGTGTSTETQETVIDNKSKTGAEESTETPETVVDNKSKTGTGTSTETQETVEDTEQGAELANSLLHYNVYKIGENKSTETQETVEDNKSKTEAGTSTETPENSEENDSKSSETNVSSGYKLITVNKTIAQENESDSEDTDSQENSEENDSTSSKSNGSNCKCKIITANNTAVNENKTTSSESNVSDLKYKIITANGTVVQNNTNAKNETKTETVTEPKSVKSSEVETETKTSNETSKGTETSNDTETSKGTETSNGTGTSEGTETSNGTNSVESEVVKSEENWTNSLNQEVNEIKVYNWTDSQGNESETPKIKTAKNSWNNIKLILSYSYPLRSFYTTNDNVNISYNGPEALGHQNVDIYLIKKYSPSSPENGTSYNINESTISLEDVLNNDTEAYVKIPATLNKEGDLTPLRLDPLQAGHYWILITPAENEEENTGSENKVLLAKYFEVLQYQLEARAPYALQEGENLEVSLDLKNASDENNSTYWVVLIKDSAYTAFEGTNPTWRMTTGIRPIVNGVDLIKSLETNLSGHESENEKEELRNEIQTLIGKDNGTISIGEKNQNNLSLKSLDLPPGNYLLLTGAYENNEGLTGISQGNLRISAENVSGLGLKPGSENTFGDESSTKFKDSPLMGLKSILENPKSFILEDVKPYIQANSLAEVLRNPPKLPSFLLGFAVTLLIGFAVLRKKK